MNLAVCHILRREILINVKTARPIFFNFRILKKISFLIHLRYIIMYIYSAATSDECLLTEGSDKMLHCFTMDLHIRFFFSN